MRVNRRTGRRFSAIWAYAVSRGTLNVSMAVQPEAAQQPRVPLSRERVLRAAVELADSRGIEALTMRNLGRELGVEAMSLYNHVANKEDLLNGVVEVVVGEVRAAVDGLEPPGGWKAVMRARILAARDVLLRHPWAPGVMETRTDIPPGLFPHWNSMLGLMLEAGFSIDLAHHAMHALGTRMLGFTRELFVTGDDGQEIDPELTKFQIRQMAVHHPHLAELMRVVSHDAESTLGSACDDQFEFEFGLDLILDGLERLRAAGWREPNGS
jgi:AcrR family transcriptional regulator